MGGPGELTARIIDFILSARIVNSEISFTTKQSTINVPPQFCRYTSTIMASCIVPLQCGCHTSKVDYYLMPEDLGSSNSH
jgi:hypothetical protein